MTVRIRQLVKAVTAIVIPEPPIPPPILPEPIEVVNNGTAYGLMGPTNETTTRLALQANGEPFNTTNANLIIATITAGPFSGVWTDAIGATNTNNVWTQLFIPVPGVATVRLDTRYTLPSVTGSPASFQWAGFSGFPAVGAVAVRNWNPGTPIIRATFSSSTTNELRLAEPLEINRNGLIFTAIAWTGEDTGVSQTPQGYTVSPIVEFSATRCAAFAFKSGVLGVEDPVWRLQGPITSLRVLNVAVFEAVEQ